ncbi:MAG: M23 family metallopeptidase [Ekhidna sp.]
MSRLLSIPSLFFALLFLGCTEEKVPQQFYPRNDHHAYEHSLEIADLRNTALGKDWFKAAEKPFQNPIKLELPYQEGFFISEKLPDAHGYQFEVKRGQKIIVDIQHISPQKTKLFVDLFRIENDSLKEFRQVASADSTLQLGFEPRRNATYLLRLQPELLRGGKFKITIENVPILDFPVAGKNKRAIQSFFGDPRDGGKRDHHGVDIFAKRLTPIIAPVKGEIRQVNSRKLGGKVVWLYDRKRGLNLYFAHLHEQKVKRYQTVNVGDTIGTVGNTGNAKYTPPHLHFGIYRNGPLDPYSFIAQEHDRVSLFEPDTSMIGKNIKIKKQAFLTAKMKRRTMHIDTLNSGDMITINAINHDYIRATNSSGNSGFLRKIEVK